MLSKVDQIPHFIFASIASRHLLLLSPSGGAELRKPEFGCLVYIVLGSHSIVFEGVEWKLLCLNFNLEAGHRSYMEIALHKKYPPEA